MRICIIGFCSFWILGGSIKPWVGTYDFLSRENLLVLNSFCIDIFGLKSSLHYVYLCHFLFVTPWMSMVLPGFIFRPAALQISKHGFRALAFQNETTITSRKWNSADIFGINLLWLWKWWHPVYQRRTEELHVNKWRATVEITSIRQDFIL